jgi:hypothetical protein
MCLLVQSSASDEDWDIYLENKDSEFSTHPRSCFKTIPPERIGLHGEYDHFGLAKRVAHTFRINYTPSHLQQLQVTQRGRVVILTGQIPNEHLLDQLVDTALSITGTFAVETCGVRLLEGKRTQEDFRL